MSQNTSTTIPSPRVTSDPRFRAGRTLIQTGNAHKGAINMFATLLEEVRQSYGDASIEAASCYYEYGNALFRGASRAAAEEEEGSGEGKETSGMKQSATAAAAAAAAEKRAASVSSASVSSATTVTHSNVTTEEKSKKRKLGENEASLKPDDEASKTEKKIKLDDNDSENQTASAEKEEEYKQEEEKDDIPLALEMMENAYSILDEYVHNQNDDDDEQKYKQWAQDQIPRILLGIGDVFSHQNQTADAADAYLRAIPHREAALECYKGKKEDLSLHHLQKQRHLVEAIVLVAEALLACDKEEDVVTTESKVVLVKKEERVEYARGYYDKARDELQEAVYLMGKIAASGQDLGTEKEDVCFLATMLMGVGNTLAEIDEQQEEEGNKKVAAKKI